MTLDGSKTNSEGHSKFLNRLFSPGVPTGFSSTSMQVVQRGAGANMSVDISIGDVHLELPSLGYSQWSWQDAVSNLAIATAPATNSRIDAVVAWVDVSVVTTASNNSPGSLKFSAVPGTVAGSPVAPADSAIQTALGSTVAWQRLSNVTVGTSVTSIVNANIADARTAIALRSSVSASSLATNAITIGYAEITSNPAVVSGATDTYVSGLSVITTIPTGGRRVEVTAYVPQVVVNNSPKYSVLKLWSGASLGALTTQLQKADVLTGTTNQGPYCEISRIFSPSAGTLAFSLSLASDSGGGTNSQIQDVSASSPAYIHVKVV